MGNAKAVNRERCFQPEPLSFRGIPFVWLPILHVNFSGLIPLHSRYADHVGITYVLCSKLRQFSYEEIEFFLPQLCHLIISVNNESMALEEFILDLCEESVNAALLVGLSILA